MQNYRFPFIVIMLYAIIIVYLKLKCQKIPILSYRDIVCSHANFFNV